MPDLEPQIRAFHEQGARFFPEGAGTWPIAEQRRLYDAYAAAFAPPRPASVLTEEFQIGGVKIREYRRADALPATTTLLYLHGGGWALGSLDSHDFITARLAADTGWPVFAVDYRLAPEHPAPAALEDSLNVARALLMVFGNRLVLAGDSAGGSLAAGVALALRDLGYVDCIAGLALLYPSLASTPSLPAAEEQQDAPGLTRAEMHFYWQQYTGGAAPGPHLCPLEAETLAGLPPCFIAVAEYDPLRDDGTAFAARLREAGGEAELLIGQGLIHGFLRAIDRSPGVARIYRALLGFLSRCDENLTNAGLGDG